MTINSTLNGNSPVLYSEQCQTFKMEDFAKRRTPECRYGTRNFSGQRAGVGDCGTRGKTQEKEVPQGNILEIYLLDTLKTSF